MEEREPENRQCAVPRRGHAIQQIRDREGSQGTEDNDRHAGKTECRIEDVMTPLSISVVIVRNTAPT